MNFPVVLDACVLYPAALRDTLLRAAEWDLYTPYWSARILSVDAGVMVRLIREQRSDVRGADMMMGRLLAALTRQAPGFVETLRIVLDAY